MAEQPVRRADDQGQPSREGREGWPAVLVHRADGDRRRQRPGRPRLRQGQRSRPRGAKGHRRGEEEPLRRPARGLDDHPPGHRPGRRGPDPVEAGRARVPASSPAARRVRSSRWPASTTSSPSRSAPRTRSTSPTRRSPGCTRLRRPDEVAALRGKSAEEVTPAGVLRAYNERRRLRRRGSEQAQLTWRTKLELRSPRSARRSAPSRSTAARCARSGFAGSVRRTCCPTAPRSVACSLGCRTSSSSRRSPTASQAGPPTRAATTPKER